MIVRSRYTYRAKASDLAYVLRTTAAHVAQVIPPVLATVRRIIATRYTDRAPGQGPSSNPAE